MTRPGHRTALIVGGSRGIGAATAHLLAADGWRILLTYRRRAGHAQRVVDKVVSTGANAESYALDLGASQGAAGLIATLAASGTMLDLLVLSAAGGMEPGASADYAWKVNDEGPARLVKALAGCLRAGAQIVYITSHEAHFYGRKTPYGDYAEIAASKKAGEQRLLATREDLEALRVSLQIVSADLVEDSPTAKLLELRRPGLLADRRAILGRLPTSADVAAEVHAAASADSGIFGTVRFVWSPSAYIEAHEQSRD